MVEVNEALVRRAIMVLPMVQGSVRDIQTGLELLLGVERSVGFIHGTLQEVAEKAAAYNAEMMPTGPVLGEADEIFCSGKPCLTVVDGDSFIVLNISSAIVDGGDTMFDSFRLAPPFYSVMRSSYVDELEQVFRNPSPQVERNCSREILIE